MNGRSMNSRLGWIGSLLFACGVTMLMLSLLGLYGLESDVYASDHLVIDSNSYGVLEFLHVQVGGLKQVEVIVTQGPYGCYSMWGNTTGQVMHPFEMALLNLEAGQVSSFTTESQGLSGGPVTHVFDFPNVWTNLDGVRISNPANNPVAVTVTAIFHGQVINGLWQATMYLGLFLSGTGILIIGVADYKKHHKLNSESKQQGI